MTDKKSPGFGKGGKVFNYEIYPTRETGKYIFKILDADSGKVLAWSKQIPTKEECLGSLKDILISNPDDIHVRDYETGLKIKLKK